MLVALSKIIPKVFNKKRADPKSGSCPVEDVLNHTCRVIMLDNSDLFLNFKLTEKAENLMNIICGKIDLVEREYFGLRYSDSVCNLRWLNLSKSLNSQLPGPGPHSIFFCVRFYAVDPCKLVTPEAKYQFYLQIKRDILHGGIHLTRDLAIQLSAYAIQAEYGDNQSEVLDDDEFMDFLFIREDSEEYRKEVQEWQKNVSGRSPTKCEFQFLDKVKWVESYGLQMYPVKSQDDLDYTIGIAPVGLYLFKKEIKMAVYCWPRLTKISYKNKTVAFKVRDRYGDEMTNSFILPSKNHAKLLWTHMLEHHTFFMLQARENVQSSTMLTITSLANFKQQQQQQHKHSRSFSASSNSSRFLSFGSKIFSKKDKKVCHNCLQPHLNSGIRQQKKCCCSDDSSLRNFLNRSLVPDLVSGSRFNEVTKTRAGLRQRRQSGSNSFHERDIPMARPSSCATIAPIVRDPADYDQVAAAEGVGDSPRSCRSSSIRWDARVLQQMRDGRNRMGAYSNSRRNNSRVGREEFESDSESESVVLNGPNDRYRRRNPMYMSAVDARRGRFRSHYDDLSFYSEIEPLEEYDVDAATGDVSRRCRRRYRHPDDDYLRQRLHDSSMQRRPRYYPDENIYTDDNGFDYEPSFRRRRHRRHHHHHHLRHHQLLQQQQQSGHIYDDLDDAMSDVTMTTNNEKDVTIRWADETLCRADGDGNKSAREFYESGRKKCRRRSKSPGMRPPRELADHFKYVDPHDEGMTDDQLKDIPYTRVETDTDGARVRYSPRTKNRIRLSRRAASSCRERNENLPPNRSIVCNDGSQSNFLPDGEAPPPYLAHQIPYKTRRSISSQALDNRTSHYQQQPTNYAEQGPMNMQMDAKYNVPPYNVASGDTNNNNSVLQQRQQYNHQQHQQSVRRQNSDSGRPRYKNNDGDDDDADNNNINNDVDYVIVRRTPSNVSMGFEV